MKIHLLNNYVMHVVDDDMLLNDDNGDVLAVCENPVRSNAQYGALIPSTAIAYLEMDPEETREGIRAAKAAGA